MIIEEELAKDLYIVYEGSGDPKDEHQIIAVKYVDDAGEYRRIGRDVALCEIDRLERIGRPAIERR